MPGLLLGLGTGHGLAQVVAEQCFPSGKFDEIEGAAEQRPQAPTRFTRPTLLIEAVPKLQELMREKGQEVEQIKDQREGLLAMPVVMFHFVAVILVDVELFILDLPAGAPDPHDRRHGLRGHDQVGHPRIVVAHRPVGPMFPDFQEIDPYGP